MCVLRSRTHACSAADGLVVREGGPSCLGLQWLHGAAGITTIRVAINKSHTDADDFYPRLPVRHAGILAVPLGTLPTSDGRGKRVRTWTAGADGTIQAQATQLLVVAPQRVAAHAVSACTVRHRPAATAHAGTDSLRSSRPVRRCVFTIGGHAVAEGPG